MIKKCNATAMQTLTILLISTLYVSHAAIAPALAPMTDHFANIDNIELLAKLSLTIAALFMGLISPIAGYLVDRYGRLKVLYISMVMFTLAGASVTLLDNIYWIIFSRAILGMALGTMTTTIITLIGDYYQGQQRTHMLGLQSAALAFGGIVYLGGNGWLADISWRLPYLLYLAGVLLLPLALLFFKEPSKAQPCNQTELVHEVPNHIGIMSLIILTGFITSIFFIMIHTQLPFILRELDHSDNSQFGLICMLFNATAFAASLLYKPLKERTDSAFVYSLMFLTMGGGYYIYGIATDFSHIVIASLISGIGIGLMFPNTSQWLLTLCNPENRGKIMGCMTLSFFVGQFVSPIIINYLLRYTDLQGVFIICATIMLILALGYLMNFGYNKFSQSKLMNSES